jgi:hypothetical protein
VVGEDAVDRIVQAVADDAQRHAQLFGAADKGGEAGSICTWSRCASSVAGPASTAAPGPACIHASRSFPPSTGLPVAASPAGRTSPAASR